MKIPVQEADLPWETWYESTDREIRGKALCDIGGTSKIGVGLMELAPESNTRPSHHHSHEEEHLMVLSGKAQLHLGEDVFELEPGSYVCFPAGQAVFHYLHNHTNSPFRYLMIGERNAEDTVFYEVDS